MKFTSTTVGTNRKTIHSNKTAKAITVIVRKPYMDTMNHTIYQMSKMVATVKIKA